MAMKYYGMYHVDEAGVKDRGGRAVQGCLAHKKQPPPLGPP